MMLASSNANASGIANVRSLVFPVSVVIGIVAVALQLGGARNDLENFKRTAGEHATALQQLAQHEARTETQLEGIAATLRRLEDAVPRAVSADVFDTVLRTRTEMFEQRCATIEARLDRVESAARK